MLDARIPDGLTSMRQGWTLDDVVHAHEFLDELDLAQARQNEADKAAASMRPRG